MAALREASLSSMYESSAMILTLAPPLTTVYTCANEASPGLTSSPADENTGKVRNQRRFLRRFHRGVDLQRWSREAFCPRATVPRAQLGVSPWCTENDTTICNLMSRQGAKPGRFKQTLNPPLNQVSESCRTDTSTFLPQAKAQRKRARTKNWKLHVWEPTTSASPRECHTPQGRRLAPAPKSPSRSRPSRESQCRVEGTSLSRRQLMLPAAQMMEAARTRRRRCTDQQRGERWMSLGGMWKRLVVDREGKGKSKGRG